MLSLPKIHINDAIPDGVLVGYNKYGGVVCCLEFYPNYDLLFGEDEDNDPVAEWNVCKAHARRIAMIVSWKNNNYVCSGTT